VCVKGGTKGVADTCGAPWNTNAKLQQCEGSGSLNS
jgi:hypothetical protein